MTTAEVAVVRHSLEEIAGEINRQHEAGSKAVARGLEHWKVTGQLLLDAKRQVGHGGWGKWLKANCKFGYMQAGRYMRLAKHLLVCSPKSNLEECTNILEAMEIISDAKPKPKPAPAGEPEVQEAEYTPADVKTGEPATNWVDKQCESVEWYTPESILETVRNYFGGPIPLDPASPEHNPTRATVHYTVTDDGLTQDWAGGGVFLNPPYGEVMKAWMAKLYAESLLDTPVLALLPCGARFSTGYWQDYVLSERLNAVCFLRGRVAFVDQAGTPQKGNPYDSALYGWNVDTEKFKAAFSQLGRVLTISEVV